MTDLSAEMQPIDATLYPFRLGGAQAFENLAWNLIVRMSAVHNEVGFDEIVNVSLRALGELTESARAYVFCSSENGLRIHNTHEWCADGASSLLLEMQQIAWRDELPTVSERLLAGEVLALQDLAQYRTWSDRERAWFERRRIHSLIAVPIRMADQLLGFIGFDSNIGGDIDRHHGGKP